MLKLYTVRDVQADSFGKIFAFNSEAEAKRTLLQACLDTQTSLGQFPDDYVLYEIGQYEEHTGVITAQDPTRVITGTEILHQHKQRMEKIDSLQNSIDEIKDEN